MTPEEYWDALSDWEKDLFGEPAGVFDREAIQAILDYQESPRPCCGVPRTTPPVARSCAYGNCVEDVCTCGVRLGRGFGPVGCPCQNEDDA